MQALCFTLASHNLHGFENNGLTLAETMLFFSFPIILFKKFTVHVHECICRGSNIYPWCKFIFLYFVLESHSAS